MGVRSGEVGALFHLVPHTQGGQSVGHLDGHSEAVGVALLHIINDFNWTKARATPTAKGLGMGAIINLLTWQLTALHVSMVTTA